MLLYLIVQFAVTARQAGVARRCTAAGVATKEARVVQDTHHGSPLGASQPLQLPCSKGCSCTLKLAYCILCTTHKLS
jgi:hypothetical protein